MGHKGFLHLLLIFLGFSWLLLLPSCDAAPSSRSFQLMKEEPAAPANFLSQKDMGFFKHPDVEEGYKEEIRIAMESIHDYPGTGANPHHDPKPPGRV